MNTTTPAPASTLKDHLSVVPLLTGAISAAAVVLSSTHELAYFAVVGGAFLPLFGVSDYPIIFLGWLPQAVAFIAIFFFAQLIGLRTRHLSTRPREKLWDAQDDLREFNNTHLVATSSADQPQLASVLRTVQKGVILLRPSRRVEFVRWEGIKYFGRPNAVPQPVNVPFICMTWLRLHCPDSLKPITP